MTSRISNEEAEMLKRNIDFFTELQKTEKCEQLDGLIRILRDYLKNNRSIDEFKKSNGIHNYHSAYINLSYRVSNLIRSLTGELKESIFRINEFKEYLSKNSHLELANENKYLRELLNSKEDTIKQLKEKERLYLAIIDQKVKTAREKEQHP